MPNGDTTILEEDKRQQLDSNIRNMLSGGASQDDVMAYATDFKTKYIKKKIGGNGSSVISSPSRSQLNGNVSSGKVGGEAGVKNNLAQNIEAIGKPKVYNDGMIPDPLQFMEQKAAADKEAAEQKRKDNLDAATNTAKLFTKNHLLTLKGGNEGEPSLSNATSKKKTDFELSNLTNAPIYQKKVSEILNGLDNGQYVTYTDAKGDKKVGTNLSGIKNFTQGISDAWKAKEEANKLLALSKDDFIKEAAKRADDTQKYLPEKPNQEGVAYQAGSAVPLVAKGTVGGLVGAAMAAAAPETGGASLLGLPAFTAWLAVTPDMALQAKASAKLQYFDKAKQQGKSNDEAYAMASHMAEVSELETAAVFTALPEFAKSSIPQAVRQGFWKGAKQFVENQPENLMKAYGVAGGGAAIRDLAAISSGDKITGREAIKDISDAGMNIVTMQLAFDILHGAVAAPKWSKAQAAEVMSNVPPEAQQAINEQAVSQGIITPFQAQQYDEGLKNYNSAKEKVSPFVAKQEDIPTYAGLQQKRDGLAAQKLQYEQSEISPALKQNALNIVDEQINAIDNQIAEMQKSNKPAIEHEVDNLTGEKITSTPPELITKTSEADVAKPEEQNTVSVSGDEVQKLVDEQHYISKKLNDRRDEIKKQYGLEDANVEGQLKKKLSKEKFENIKSESDALLNRSREISDKLESLQQGKPTEPTPTISKPITTSQIHAAARDAGIDYESKGFMEKSKELTGEEHLDNMNPEQLGKMMDYVKAKPDQKGSGVLGGEKKADTVSEVGNSVGGDKNSIPNKQKLIDERLNKIVAIKKTAEGTREERTKRYNELVKEVGEDKAIDALNKEIRGRADKEIEKLPEIPKSWYETVNEKGESDYEKIRKELGFKDSGKAWGDKPFDEEMGDILTNKENDAAIFIKPHTEEIYDEVEDISEEITNGIKIELVNTKGEARGKGKAKELIQKITDWADKNNTDIYLDIAPQDAKTTEAGLKKLYEGFGFEFNGIHGKRKSKSESQPTKKVSVGGDKSALGDVENKKAFNFLKQRQFGDEFAKKAVREFKDKDGNRYYITKKANQDLFTVYDAKDLDAQLETGGAILPKSVAVATFDTSKLLSENGFFTGFKEGESIKVQTEFRRKGIATALIDFAEQTYNRPYKPTNLLSESMQKFVDARQNTKSESLLKEQPKPEQKGSGVLGDVTKPLNELEKIPYDKRTDAEHSSFIKQKFVKEFTDKGVPKEHVDAAVVLMDARAKVANPENPDAYFRKIEDVGNGEFQHISNTMFQDVNAVFETRDGKKIGFNYDTDQVARERFDIPKLKKIGSGSDRDVYDLGNGKVLKIAKTARGLTQNISEGDGMLSGSIIPESHEIGLNYVVVDNAPRLKTSDVVATYSTDGSMTETGSATAGEMLKEFQKFSAKDFENHTSGIQDALNKYGFNDLLNYDVLWNDFTAQRNWGYKDGKALHTDAGTFGGGDWISSHKGVKNLSDPEFREIYNKSRALKKQFGDTDKNTMYQGEKGAVETLANGRKIIHALDAPDFSTAVHEIAHIFEDELNDADKKVITDWSIQKEWDRNTSEAFATGFEAYLKEGNAPTPELKTIFEKAKQWLTDIYNKLRNNSSIKLTPELRKVFDNLFKEPEQPKPENLSVDVDKEMGVEIKAIEEKRNTDLKEASKPKVKLNLINNKEAWKKIAKLPNAEEIRSKHIEIKEKYKSLLQLIECE